MLIEAIFRAVENSIFRSPRYRPTPAVALPILLVADTKSDLVVARFTAAGGSAGTSTTALAAFATSADAAIQPGNQLVTAVSFTGTNTTELFRFTTSGTEASSISTTGTNPHLAIEPDGKIVLGVNQTGDDFSLLRYLSDGVTLDTLFAAGGPAPGPFGDLESLAIAPSGKIVAAGVDAALSGPNDWALAAFNADGSSDNNFVDGTTNELPVPLSGSTAALMIQPDGKLLVAGQTAGTDAFFARYGSGGLGVDVVSVPPTNLNVVPSATTIIENGSVSLTGTFGEANPNQICTVDVAWGDGTLDTFLPLAADSMSFDIPAHQFTAAGSYSIEVSVTDDLGVGPSFTIPITVNPLPSSGLTLLLVSQSIVIGDTSVLTGTFASAGTAGTRTITLDWGDGTTETPDTTVITLDASQLTFAVPIKNYASPGEYVITAQVTDGSGTYEAVQTAVSAAYGPLLTVSENLSTLVNQDLSIPAIASYVDANYTAANGAAVGATIAYSILWGDGGESDGSFSPDPTQTPASGTIPGDHTYTSAGVYTVTVIMSDSAGSESQKSFYVNVTNPALSLDNLWAGSQPYGNWVSDEVYEDDIATVTGSVGNLNGAAYTINATWGDGSTDSYPIGAGESSFAIHHYYTTDDAAGTDSPAIHLTFTTSDLRTAWADTSVAFVHFASVEVTGNPAGALYYGEPIDLGPQVSDLGESGFQYSWTIECVDTGATRHFDTPTASFTIDDSSSAPHYQYELNVTDDDGSVMYTGGTVGYNEAVPDDSAPTVTIAETDSPGFVIEGQTATFTVTLNNGGKPLNHVVTLDYSTQDITAKAGTDYDSTNGPIKIKFDPSNGQNVTTETQTFTVNTLIDQNAQSTQTFKANLGHVVGAAVIDSSAPATINYAQMVMHQASDNGNDGAVIPTASMANPGATYFVVGSSHGYAKLEINAFTPSSFDQMVDLNYNSSVIEIFTSTTFTLDNLLAPGETFSPQNDSTYYVEAIGAGTSPISLDCSEVPAGTLATGTVTVYNIQLTADGTPVSTDQAHPTSDEIIGQSYTFAVSGAPSTAKIEWSPPSYSDVMVGDFLPSDSRPSPIAPGGPQRIKFHNAPAKAGDPVEPLNVRFDGAWVQGGNRSIKVVVTIPGLAPQTITGFFNVGAPNAVATLTPFNGGDRGVTQGPNSDANYPLRRYTQFGSAQPVGVISEDAAHGQNGVTWQVLNNSIDSSKWDYAWLQIAGTDLAVNGKTAELSGLDGRVFYDHNQLSGDDPGVSISPGDNVTYTIAAETFLMVESKLGGGTWVPVAQAPWDFSETIAYPFGAQNITVEHAWHSPTSLTNFTHSAQFPSWDIVCTFSDLVARLK